MKKFFALVLLLAVSIPAHAEWKLGLLWKKSVLDFGDYGFTSMQLSPNDSTLFANLAYSVSHKCTRIAKLNAINGEVIKYTINLDTISNFTLSKDGSYLSASGNGLIGLVDTNEFRYTTKIEFPNIINHHYNENKGIIAGYSKNTIRQYDIKTKTLIKEYDSSYFKIKDVEITGIALPSIEDRFVYGFKYFTPTGPKPGDGDGYSGIRVINNEGKVLFEKINKNIYTDFNLFTISNDGTKVAYFYNDPAKIKIAIFDLSTLKVLGTFDAGEIPNNLMFSRDDKYLYNGTQESLIQIDLTNLKRDIVNSNTTFIEYLFNTTNDVIFINFGSHFSTYKIDSQSSIKSELLKNTFLIHSNPVVNQLILSTTLIDNYNLVINLINIKGMIVRQLANGFEKEGTFVKNYEIQALPSGTYYLQIKLNNEIYPQTIKFIKVS